MHLDAATALIAQTFNSRFDEQTFETFAANVLNTVDRSRAIPSRHGVYIPDAFKAHIRQYKRPFSYTDPNGERIDVLIVRLQNATGLDRARTMQRNFIAHYIGVLDHAEPVDAVLAAFYHDDVADWRFSLVRLEYLFGDEGAAQKLTPARRYSFLVGPTEPTHTAEHQLRPFLVQDAANPTIDDLARAFQIEVVSKRFFVEYTDLFHDLLDELEGLLAADVALATDFRRAEILVPNFAKKLLGQIVFLYFVQKKGWLGVASDEKWGTGPKDFLRRLYAKADGVTYANFFNDVLEPLFYDALAVKREGDRFRVGGYACQIPFLNGGLFEPMGGYDWRNTGLLLPNRLFSNRKHDADDTGTGILDVFDRYNFTVWEEEPLEKEVAVDPEMLGKVFENLLEVQDRKSKGAFYTPREIVHYMCQESLINFLDTAVNGGGETGSGAAGKRVPRTDLAVLVRQGALALQQDVAKEAGLLRGEHVLPAAVRTHAQALDDALAGIKLCDPAIGSGAFPVGMLHEIVQARQALDTQIQRKPSAYSLKRHAIQESIYGVDIDPGAVEIAKLRLWLSLVVDEESYANIQPLPNLDYKIVCGNSLLGYPYVPQGLTEVEQLKIRFFNETDHDERDRLKQQIDQKIYGLFKNTEKSLGYQVTIDFRINFSEVYRVQDGFDVVIANPPYVDSEEMVRSDNELRQNYQKRFSSAKGNWDLFIVFIEMGLTLLRRNGTITYIVPNKLIAASYAEKLRENLSKYRILELRDFSEVRVFKEADVYPVVFLIQKSQKQIPVQMVVMSSEVEEKSRVQITPEIFYSDIFWDRYFVDNPRKIAILEKILRYPKLSLYAEILGAATVGEAYEIKNYIQDRGHASDIEFRRLINTGTIDPYMSLFGIKKTRYIKGQYLFPVISHSDLASISERRLEQAQSSKIIIGGMTKRLECYLDAMGIYLAGKSTTIVIEQDLSLYFLIGVLNSKLITFFYSTYFNSLSLAGGYLRIGPPQIKAIPIAYEEGKATHIIEKVKLILSLCENPDDIDKEGMRKLNKYLGDIDELVFDLYELDSTERKIVGED